MIRFLIALYPEAWRRRYGEEFAALLEDSRLTPRSIIDVVGHAARLRLRAHLDATLVAAALLISVCVERIAVDAGLSDNIFWAPTTPLRALALLATIGPWAAVILRVHLRRRRHRAGAHE